MQIAQTLTFTSPESFRFLLIGDLGVGKTALIRRFCENRFVPEDTAGIRPPDRVDQVRFYFCIEYGL